MSQQPQIKQMEEFICSIYMRDVYRDLNPTAEQQDDDNWWNDVFIETATNSDKCDFQEKWAEYQDPSPYDAFLIIEMINKINQWHDDEFGETWTYESPLTYKKIFNMFAYMFVRIKGLDFWQDQQFNEIDEETDDNCPVCMDAYSSQKPRFEGVGNNEYKKKCHHYCDFCCCDCWLELSAKKIGEKDQCPICKAENNNPLFKS